MGYYKPDLYNQPEKFGMEIIGDVDWDMEPYQFDLTAVLVDPITGSFYSIYDSGCSCPSPFEDFTSRDKLGDPMTAWEIIKELEEERDRLIEEDADNRWVNRDHLPGDIADLIQKIRNYVHVPHDNIEVSNN